MAEEVDIVVVGLGVGGEEAAGKLAEAGLSVVGIEHRLVGGECPYWACIPSKMMIRAGNLLAETRRVDGMAGHATVEPPRSAMNSRRLIQSPITAQLMPRLPSPSGGRIRLRYRKSRRGR